MSVINTNVKSLVAADAINSNNNRLSTAMQRLSTGLRVNGAKDDAAGLAIGSRMDAQVRGLNMAIKNANDGVSLLQTAEGAMAEVTNALQRMRELAVQAATDTNTAKDRAALNDEYKQLQSEIDRISAKTQFNGMNLLDGSFRNKQLQIGDRAGNTLEISVNGVATSGLGAGAINTQGVIVGDRWNSLDSLTAASLKINGVTINSISATLNDSVNAKLDIADAVAAINSSNAGVTASAYNEVVANTVGTGYISAADKLRITVAQNGSGARTEVNVSATNSLQQIVDSINAQGGASTVQAKINDEGKLVLFNDSGATISIADVTSSTTGSYDTASGFGAVASDVISSSYVSATPSTWGTSYKGILKLASNTGEAITVTDSGNGANANKLGLNATTDDGTIKGAAVTALTGATTTDYFITSGTLVINGVDIWDANNPYNVEGADALSTANNMAALINKFSEKTGVVAGVIGTATTTAYLTLKSSTNAPITIDIGNDATDANKQTIANAFGLKAQNIGASDFNSNTGRISDYTGGGTVASTSILQQDTATSAIAVLDGALDTVSSSRSKLGAYLNRLDSTVNNLSNVVTNTEASKSRIIDADYATETTKLARAQILQQAATAMLAQANQSAQTVLTLLK